MTYKRFFRLNIESSVQRNILLAFIRNLTDIWLSSLFCSNIRISISGLETTHHLCISNPTSGSVHVPDSGCDYISRHTSHDSLCVDLTILSQDEVEIFGRKVKVGELGGVTMSECWRRAPTYYTHFKATL